MPRFGTGWRDAFGRRAAARPARSEVSIDELVGTREARRVQIDAAYRRAVREARAAGRAPPQRKSIERRFQRYAAAAGRERRRPSAQELAKMRRAYHTAQRKAAGKSEVLATMQRINREGGTLMIERPYLRVSPKARRGDRRGRPRYTTIAVRIEPGQLDRAIAAEERDARSTADDAMTPLVIGADYFEGRISGTDTTITDIRSASLES